MTRMARLLLKLGIILSLVCALPGAAAQSGARSNIHSDVEIAGLLNEIEAGTARSTRLTAELAGQDERRLLAKAALRQRVRTLYRMTRAGRTPVAAGYKAVMRHVARVKRLKRIVQVHAGDLNRLQARSGELRGLIGQADAGLQRSRRRLATVQERGSTRLPTPGFTQLLSGQSTNDYRAPASTSSYGLHLVDEDPGGGFMAMRGNLASPVSGEVRIVDAQREESDGPGLEFQAPSGTAVRSTAAGRVAFADRYGSYGQLVILDHQDGYYTVYGGLGGVEVQVGDDLSRRARIGVIGNHGRTPALFFEVRKGTRTLPPRPWLGF